MLKNKFVASKGLAMLQCKCPRCQSGDMFVTKSTSINNFMRMHETCPVCELRFEIEPGFFWGAMYVSYALTTGLMLITLGTLWLGFNDPEFWVYVVSIICVVFLTLPWVFRYSRMLMIYLFSPLRFDKNYVKQ
jgi:uncharacterized protein (DUF983 family)